ncbi:MAG: hypothetical protein KKA90_02340 [Nanoarchaeota archaeon]|nr:hypothetical protein [Nanoarchaeota archaeon]
MLDPWIREECGVAAIVGKEKHYPAARMVREGMRYLGHRGHDGYGVVTFLGEDGNPPLTRAVKLGPVGDDFSESSYRRMRGSSAVGHNRYATSNARGKKSLQPLMDELGPGYLSLAHNGTIENGIALARRMLEEGERFTTGRATQHAPYETTVSDSEVFLRLIGRSDDVVTGIQKASQTVRGGYAAVVMDQQGVLYAFRDPRGIKPLCMGRNEDAVGVFSENVVFNSSNLRMEFDQDLEPGVIYRMSRDGIDTFDLPDKGKVPYAGCLFENVYFGHEGSTIDGVSVHGVRVAGGRMLGKKAKEMDLAVEKYVTVPIPFSGMSWAEGFAEETGRPFTSFLHRQREQRSFILDRDEYRKRAAIEKFILLREAISQHPYALVVDDSGVRGNVSRQVARRLRDAGVKELHYFFGFPQVIAACPWGGIDMKTSNEQMANAFPQEEDLRKFLKADSVTFNFVGDLVAAMNSALVRKPPWRKEKKIELHDLCTHCISRMNPFQLQEHELYPTDT